MGAGFAVILLGIIILLLVPFIYFGIRMAGYPRAAIGISLGVFLVVSIPLISLAYRGKMYSKDDALVDFQAAKIQVKGPLRILTNDISGFKSVQQETTFILDSTEVNEIIKRIENRNDFLISPTLLNLRDEMNRKHGNNVIRNYRHKEMYIIETYDKLDEYTVKSSEFIFKKNNDTVQFKKLEDY
ncbi:hypothetical protein [Faecalibacter bovis]|uniref:Uncharacterized protein n=1 Tax=Faecalibacter bovis TaxID=2898187 RepID=A0ABX7XBY8_9FLAO|nr:hypothetical protein [Faecalibacter bovis]MBS7332790.1 hypothetical protein [Weeksellaceae bacterium]QTV05429.1 hypothetical protein J9309_11740 [Faecalibacter bovis]